MSQTLPLEHASESTPGPTREPIRRRVALGLAVLAFLTVPAVAGYEVGRNDGPAATAESTRALLPDEATTRSPGTVEEIVDAVDGAVVNLTTRVEGGGRAAGTGIVISPSGLVLTNNHVISGTTSLEVEFGGSGVTRSAKVLGYSVVADVALLQVQNVSNLEVADLGDSSSLSVGDLIVAVGNAGGRGGSPRFVSGTVTALEQQITASDAGGANVRTLEGLIEVAASIRSGDSGGPVVDENATVVGMSVAASAGNGFGFPGRAGGEGYAIPIEDALAIAEKIVSGEGGADIRVGATRAVLGVAIQPSLRSPRGGFPGGMSGGAQVVGVEDGSGADKAGLAEGDVIVALGDRTISVGNDLIEALVRYEPGDTVPITWRNADGETRRASVKLGEGPPA